ncbi:MAG: sulfur carrier protein ThiS [Planctomycetota bacterium]
MQITLNGTPRQVAPNTTLAELIDEITQDRTRVAVERNRAIAPRAQWDETVVADGDEIEVVTLVGGG